MSIEGISLKVMFVEGCGKEGCDGHNLICQNNHEIGTEMSYFWQLRLVALDPTLVEYSLEKPNERDRLVKH